MVGQFLGRFTDFYRSSDLNMTYTDYLQQRELDDQLAIQISKPIKELITAQDRALGAQVTQLKAIEAAQTEAAYKVELSVQDLRLATEEGFRRVGSVLEWGFSSIILQLGRTNDLLKEIRNLVANPSLTWAYEKFNRARDLHRRRHYVDALDSINMAISGHGNELGESTEHRFHFLRGIILLGDQNNTSPEVVNLEEAERAFLVAAKYAAHDLPNEAAQSQLCAARAANLRAHYSDGALHAEKGLQYQETAGLHYELARALLQLGQWDKSKHHLKRAIRLDKRLLLKACGDPALRGDETFLQQAFGELLSELREIADNAARWLAGELERVRMVTYSSPTTGEVIGVDESRYSVFQDAGVWLRDVESIRSTGGIADIREAIEGLEPIWLQLKGWNHLFISNVSARLYKLEESYRKSAEDLLKKADSAGEVSGGCGWAIAAGVGTVGLALLVVQLSVSFGTTHADSGLPGFLLLLAPVVAFFFFYIGENTAKERGRAAAGERRTAGQNAKRVSESILSEAKNLHGSELYIVDSSILEIVPNWACQVR
jgi:tetratricopeptide (TPR) repeat protein